MVVWWKPTIGSFPRVNQFDVSLSNNFTMIQWSSTIQFTITLVFTIHGVLPEPAFGDHRTGQLTFLRVRVPVILAINNDVMFLFVNVMAITMFSGWLLCCRIWIMGA